MSNGGSGQLETDQVFIDTQAWVKERLNWRSKSCSRLRELVRSRQVQVLTTSVTRSEVRSQIQKSLEHARDAMRKYDVVLGQLQNENAARALEGPEVAAKLQGLFDAFMKDLGVIEVPLSKDVDKIFDDYFHERPPFSAKKKSEFPDAFVVSSLQERARKTGKNIYVVSGDGDLKACCAHASELMIVESIAEIISKATVTKTIHDELLSFLRSSEALQEKLTELLMQAPITVRGGSRSYVNINMVAGGVASVDEIHLSNLNVITRKGTTFFCDVEVQAALGLWFEIEVETREWAGEEEQEFSDEFTAGATHYGVFNAEIEVQFDSRNPAAAAFDNLICSAEIEVDASEIDELRRYQR